MKGGLVWVTTPFVWRDGVRRDYVALYRWNQSGEFLSARIEELTAVGKNHGPPIGMNRAQQFYQAGIERALRRLVEFEPGDIEVAPFVHLRQGIEFGLIARPPDVQDEESQWSVSAMPGDYMSFVSPWNGDYDT